MAKKSQIQKFREAARGLECSDERFDAALKAIATHAPANPKKPSKEKVSRNNCRVDAWEGLGFSRRQF